MPTNNSRGLQEKIGRVEGHNFRGFEDYKLISVKKSKTFELSNDVTELKQNSKALLGRVEVSYCRNGRQSASSKTS